MHIDGNIYVQNVILFMCTDGIFGPRRDEVTGMEEIA